MKATNLEKALIFAYVAGYTDDLKFCEDLAERVGVGAVPGSSFFREPVNHLIRFHFAKKNETLEEALSRLKHIREKMS